MLAKIVTIVILLAVALAGGAIYRNNVPVFDPPGAFKRLLVYLTRNSVETRPGHDFPELRTRTVAQEPDAAWGQVLKAVERLGWTVQEQDGPRRALHAVVATPWLRFKDDLRISVEAASGGGSNVNVSSRSRVGRADFGANLSHVMRFYQTLEAVAGSS